ncbi:hypothetical protein T03_527, partial [Trichinella britovi]
LPSFGVEFHDIVPTSKLKQRQCFICDNFANLMKDLLT